MTEQSGYISHSNWRDKYDRFRHFDIYTDYMSDNVMDNERISYREEYWEYLEENGYWE